MQKFDSLFKSKNIFFIAIVIFVLYSFTLYHNRSDILKLFKSESKDLTQTIDTIEKSKSSISEEKNEAPLLSTKSLLNYVSSLQFPEAPTEQKLDTIVSESKSIDYTADTSKVGSQISGEPAQRTEVREHRRIPKFDVPNLEVSKVYTPKSYSIDYIHYLLNVNLLVCNFMQDEDYSKELKIVNSTRLPQDIKNIFTDLEAYNNNYHISKSKDMTVIFPKNHKWLEKFIKIEQKPSEMMIKEQDKAMISEKLKYLVDFLYSEKFMQEFINKDV